MLRTMAIAVVALGIFVAMASVANGSSPLAPNPKPDKQTLAVYVVAPMDGIFWRGIFSGAAPYVEVGATVDVNTVVARIEHMRSTSLTAGIEGTVVEILVVDGQLVKAWQPLVKILPKPKKKK